MEAVPAPTATPSVHASTSRTPFLQEVTARARRVRPLTRRTRIVATIGPASDSEPVLEAMAAAGMDVARVPLAHGSIEDAVERVRRIRSAAPKVGILADLPGPKVRCSPFAEGGALLVTGSELELVRASQAPESSAGRIGVALDEAVTGLHPGDAVALGDGGVSLVVTETGPDGARCVVRSGGRIQGRPGVTVPAGRLSLATPTTEDLERLEALLAVGIDIVAVSFVRSAADMLAVRAAIGLHGTMLCAKIETPEAIDDLDAILACSDAVMVARGDLGVRVPLEDVPHHQKHIIRAGVRFARPVITATQMLESMTLSPVPTRAEVTDVANAVLDGSSAVMLSAETAVGVDPVNVCDTMARIVLRTERDFDYLGWGGDLGVQSVSGDAASSMRITAAITGAAWRAAIEEDAAAIIACTRSGATARAVSRFRPAMPIVAATPSIETARQLSMSWGVDTVIVPESESTDEVIRWSVEKAVEAGFAAPGDVVVVVAGSPLEPPPAADTVRLVRVH